MPCATWRSTASKSDDTSQDWTDSFVEEFRKRRGYDPIPYLPALKGKSFADPHITSRFQHDYRKTVSDLWIDGHYRASTKFLNTYGMQLVAEAGHGGYPRVEPLRACGVVDIPRGEFWNGSQFWVVKEAASAAHIYGRQIVDCGVLHRLAELAGRAAGIQAAGRHRVLRRAQSHHLPHLRAYAAAGRSAGKYVSRRRALQCQCHLVASSQAPMLSYFSRCCYLLQQGLPVADVCYLLRR